MTKSLLKYILTDRKTIILLLIVILAIIVMFVDINGSKKLEEFRKDYWSPIVSTYISLGAFIFSTAIYLRTVYGEWKESLPKRLSVYFLKDGHKCMMQCNYAFLSGESDIRQTAQQIGAQIANYRYLDFNIANIFSKELDIVSSAKEVNDLADKKSLDYPFRHYSVVIHLTDLPSSLDEGYTYIWQPPFDIRLTDDDKDKLRKAEQKREAHINEEREGDAPRVYRIAYNFKQKMITTKTFDEKYFFSLIHENKGLLRKQENENP